GSTPPTGGGSTPTPPPTTTSSTSGGMTISASPASITSGNVSTVTWSAPNATACIASGGWSGARPNSGTFAASPTGTPTYTLTCKGRAGASTVSVTVAVNAAPAAVSGVCGSANGTTASAKPSANLCSAGTASSVAGSGPWTWSCGGSNGGTT